MLYKINNIFWEKNICVIGVLHRNYLDHDILFKKKSYILKLFFFRVSGFQVRLTYNKTYTLITHTHTHTNVHAFMDAGPEGKGFKAQCFRLS